MCFHKMKKILLIYGADLKKTDLLGACMDENRMNDDGSSNVLTKYLPFTVRFDKRFG